MTTTHFFFPSLTTSIIYFKEEEDRSDKEEVIKDKTSINIIMTQTQQQTTRAQKNGHSWVAHHRHQLLLFLPALQKKKKNVGVGLKNGRVGETGGCLERQWQQGSHVSIFSNGDEIGRLESLRTHPRVETCGVGHERGLHHCVVHHGPTFERRCRRFHGRDVSQR